MALDHLLKDARKARLADDYESAIKLCRAFLEVSPQSPDGESFLGLCEIETGLRAGEARMVKAAEAAPKNAGVLLNLSILRERQGDLRGAVASANAAASVYPRCFKAWAQLGKLLGKGDKFDEAFAALDVPGQHGRGRSASPARAEAFGLPTFCVLEWNEACLSFHEQDSAVLMFSAAPFREAPSAKRASSAGPHRSRLSPLINSLKDLRIDLQSGARRRPH